MLSGPPVSPCLPFSQWSPLETSGGREVGKGAASRDPAAAASSLTASPLPFYPSHDSSDPKGSCLLETAGGWVDPRGTSPMQGLSPPATLFLISQLYAGWGSERGVRLGDRCPPVPFGRQHSFGRNCNQSLGTDVVHCWRPSCRKCKFLIKIEINPLPQLPAISSQMSKSFMLLINVIAR